LDRVTTGERHTHRITARLQPRRNDSGEQRIVDEGHSGELSATQRHRCSVSKAAADDHQKRLVAGADVGRHDLVDAERTRRLVAVSTGGDKKGGDNEQRKE
jgi:hypothetical protein